MNNNNIIYEKHWWQVQRKQSLPALGEAAKALATTGEKKQTASLISPYIENKIELST